MTSLSRRGYTLLEILVAVTLMLMIMLGLTQLFSSVGTQINNTQATLQLVGDLRGVKNRLESDLKMVTADLTKAPPMKTGLNQGYFCIIEGMGAAHKNALLRSQNRVTGDNIAYTSDSSDPYDNTVGDMDDILMFTAHAPEGQPFRGLIGGQVRESNMAEIIWFCRGNTLYRRTLLIIPDLEFQTVVPAPMKQPEGFYRNNDVSVRFEGGRVVANTLENLALRQNRFGHTHTVSGSIQQAYPFNIHKSSAAYYMRMPTIQETSDEKWDVSKSFDDNLVTCFGLAEDNDGPFLSYKSTIGALQKFNGTNSSDLPADGAGPFIDYWENPFPWSGLASTSARYAEDVISTNVISFDIQVWDEVAGRYVNLGEANTITLCYDDGVQAGPLGMQGKYPLKTTTELPCVYDTWNDEYEREGYEWPNQAGTPTPTLGRNQKDDFGIGVIDHIDEWTTSPPYDVPLRGIKITIRTFDPLSKNIREMTVVHNFVGK